MNAAIEAAKMFNKKLNRNRYARPCESALSVHESAVSTRNLSPDVRAKMGIYRERERRGYACLGSGGPGRNPGDPKTPNRLRAERGGK